VEGAVVKQLRKRLFAEHLQLDIDDKALDIDVSSDAFYRDIFYKRAKDNTMAYRNLFFCLPDDTVHTWADYRAAKEKEAKLELKVLSQSQLSALESIKGHIVLFPAEFLVDEDLSASIFSREFLLPLEVYI
jgi:phospholipase D1/2